jgi:hypothetical protein
MDRKPMYWHINSFLHVSALPRRHLQGVQHEPAEFLHNVVKVKWDDIWQTIQKALTELP